MFKMNISAAMLFTASRALIHLGSSCSLDSIDSAEHRITSRESNTGISNPVFRLSGKVILEFMLSPLEHVQIKQYFARFGLKDCWNYLRQCF